MGLDAIIVMLIGMVLLWGGLAVSITSAIKKSK
ncbi:methionine/alanine import family NSS transporter small subunit [Halalkalibacillus sediminis]|nr:methionine/alanine import family NSS transporter small subunit [Halalkalibacillus sediminis]